jgi:serine/threonine protein kinase
MVSYQIGLQDRYTRLPRSNLMAWKVFARKVLRLGAFLSEQEIQNEIRAVNKVCLESVAHENVVAVYRHGNLVNSPAVYFFDMELGEFNLETYIPHLWEPTSLEKVTLVDQSTLIVKLESRIKYIWAIMSQIPKGVAFIHQQKEVHRDLKPHGNMAFSYQLDGSPLFRARLQVENRGFWNFDGRNDETCADHPTS